MSTAPPEPLSAALIAVSAGAAAQLEPIWLLPPPSITPALFEVVPAVVDTWTTASTSVAADWYDLLREANEIRGRFTAIVEPLQDWGSEALAGWGTEPLTREEPDVEAARSRIEGGVQKRIVNAANKTITQSATEDPQARGWMRRTRPQACKFCIMVASRGGVFTKASSTFACHEHCYCEAVPAWGGQALPVKPYKPSDKPSTPADRARVRQWIKKNL